MAESTAVYIGKLIFEDYHSFKGQNVLDLMDKESHLYQWTVFLGNNNTGKTTLLKAIGGLTPVKIKISPTKEDEPLKTFEGFIPYNSTGYLNDIGNAHNEKIKTELFGGNLIFEKSNPSSNLFTKKILDKTIKQKNLISPDKPYWYYSNKSWAPSEDKLIINFKLYGYGVTRKASNNGISDNSDSENLNIASLFNSEFKLTNIEEWLFQLDYASKNGQSAAGERLQLLKEIIKSEILPEILDFRFTTTEELRNYIEYQTKEGWFLFEQLGYGYQATMAWIIDLCKKMFERYPGSPNPLKEPAIVLVDELDLHLHPKWQKTIVDYLTKTFTSTQFIVTTHSPLILQTIEKVNLFALIKAEDRVNIRHIPTETLEGWSVEEILREVMEMDEGVYSDRYNELYKEFDAALDSDNYEAAKTAYEKLLEILHPTSPERKILKLQLSQIAPVNDKA